MEYIQKAIELIGLSLMWILSLSLLFVAVFGGELSFKSNGMAKLFDLWRK